MTNAKKKIILNEILFWKQNKLLPDHYCDFLMTLYTEGNEIELDEQLDYKKSIKAREKRNRFQILSCIALLSIALLIALFTVTELVWLVAPIVMILALILMILAYRFAKKNEILTPILHIASALLLFGLSVKISITYFLESPIVLYLLLIINCFLWLYTGLKFKLMYFTVSGAIGLVILIGYQMSNLFIF